MGRGKRESRLTGNQIISLMNKHCNRRPDAYQNAGPNEDLERLKRLMVVHDLLDIEHSGDHCPVDWQPIANQQGVVFLQQHSGIVRDPAVWLILQGHPQLKYC
jgi:hypothetical protein